MGTKITEEIILQIQQIYEETHNKAETARRLGISTSTVTRYLTALECSGLISTEQKKKQPEIAEELIEQINQVYSECLNKTETSRRLGVTVRIVNKYLTEENKTLSTKQNDDLDALWYYIIRTFGIVDEDNPVSKWNIMQMQKFKKQGISYKAQLLTLQYFYDIKKNSIEKSNGSIGIIPHVFQTAAAYYKKLDKERAELEKAIKEQLEKDRIEIKYKPSDYIGKKKKKKQIDLNSL